MYVNYVKAIEVEWAGVAARFNVAPLFFKSPQESRLRCQSDHTLILCGLAEDTSNKTNSHSTFPFSLVVATYQALPQRVDEDDICRDVGDKISERQTDCRVQRNENSSRSQEDGRKRNIT